MKALSIRNLKKTYANGLVAIKGIDLDVEQGDFFALLGPNGAGKSTTIGIISSLVNASSGEVKIFNVDLKRNTQLAKSYIGLVPQEVNFNQFETARNIVMNQAGYYGMPRKEAKVQTERCLKLMYLWGQRDRVSRRLSGGMKRRVMIARALVHKPKLLILDEPTAGVDIEIRRSMWETMKQVNEQGTTIILTTHYLEEAENLCRNIAIINQGEIVENTNMQSLLARLNEEHFICDLKQPIKRAPKIAGYQIELLNALQLSIAVPKALGLNQLFQGLSEVQVEVTSMKNKSNRLERLFLDLVDQDKNKSA
ncbi:ABC transporter ATP-binding protein [methanotrophic endosymbiont of Bathymodiolus puteoserpentis (Logatchev)]|jgi:ABC-2 type transport system ATP-binding protein|uniref:ABC transporter ATP-binding protein n=1 Tax=methanotrophic endosymbiont of Bathymodiolus puteoserpentis (Logatchev) TaxID=343235 RepID=UPI0013C98270|nr:ABC transporter ATP-binding protein [methanotrophic endosymbiont of Bathymodiolus puteoserpentis (Logatchev)]SHE20000.1 ABC-type multidrug transport system, ATPase component [methanotrophic endosymbiont of Bathymodiolus puteoserpentis (Logatchev)]